MLEIFKEVLEQIDNKEFNNEFISDLNGFFMALNSQLKGDKSSLIKVEPSNSSNYLITNLYSDYMAIRHINGFLLDLRDYFMAFSDNQELLYDIFLLLLEFNIIELSHSLRLLLFKKLYLSGYFCYVALDSQDFKDNYSFISQDLQIITNIVSQDNIKAIDSLLSITLSELYLFNNIDLKDLLI